jgi:hypothetical protein
LAFALLIIDFDSMRKFLAARHARSSGPEGSATGALATESALWADDVGSSQSKRAPVWSNSSSNSRLDDGGSPKSFIARLFEVRSVCSGSQIGL